MFRSSRSVLPIVLLAASLATAGAAMGEAVAPGAHRPQGAAAKLGPPLSVEARAVMDLRTAGSQQIESLMRSLAAARDEAARRDLQRQITQAKLGTEVKILRLRATQARAKGDLAAAQQLEMFADGIEHPKAPARSVAQSPNKQLGAEGRQP